MCLQFDTIDRYDPSTPDGPSWLLSVEKAEWSDRISSTIVNHRLREGRTVFPIYSNVQAGVILKPEYARILCSYSKVCYGSEEAFLFPSLPSQHM